MHSFLRENKDRSLACGQRQKQLCNKKGEQDGAAAGQVQSRPVCFSQCVAFLLSGVSSGLLIETIVEGDGEMPKNTSTVKVHYTGEVCA